MDREKVQELADKENWREKRKLAATVLLASVAVFAAAIILRPSTAPASRQPELTQYQKSYVDCPAKYLPLCTKMSKIPTEEVRFKRVEDGRLYLEMPRTNRTLVARIQQGGQDGYLISIRD